MIATLTPLEREILMHRLAVPDSLAEVLDEYHQDDVYAVVDLLKKSDVWGAERVNRPLTFEVLADAVEGSTYFGAAKWDASAQKQAAILRAGESLADKVGEYIGRKIEFPNY